MPSTDRGVVTATLDVASASNIDDDPKMTNFENHTFILIMAI